MNKYTTLLFLVLFTLGCSEDKIHLAPVSQESSKSFYKTAEDIERAVVAVYDGLQSYGQYGQYFVYLMEVRSDNSMQQSTTNSGGMFGDLDLFRQETTNTVIDQAWKASFNGILRCNIVLNRIDNVTDNPNKDTQLGEVKFIRALTYFNLVRLFGDVPLVTLEFDDPFLAFNVGRSPKDEVYKLIIQDLTEAAQLLKDKPSRPGGANVNAANALLGKVYLTLHRYEEAVTVLELVSGRLLTNYVDVFGIANENNAESLFEIQFTKGGIGEGSPYANLFAPYGSTDLIGGVGTAAGDNLPTMDLYNSYEINDLRKNATIGITRSNVLYTKKYLDVPTSDKDGENNFIVLRYADVILMLAEALNEIQYEADGKAFTLINQIRTRAGISKLTGSTTPDQESFRNAISKERRLELAFENHRWFDLVRTGKAIEVMTIHNSTVNGAQPPTEHKLLLPIPQSQINTANLTQNPGY